jgi:nicotinamide mononucleotide transporter
VTLPPGVLRSFEIVGTLAGVAYIVLAARRNRWCWIAGAVGSGLAGIVFACRALPMQAALNAFYVIMSGYGWLRWTRSTGEGELPVGVWPLGWHLGAALALVALTFVSARLLSDETHSAWPLLDSLTTWFSLLATWLTARGKLENWLYWIVIDTILVYLFFVQAMPLFALLYLVYVVIAAAGFIAWRRRFRAQEVPT